MSPGLARILELIETNASDTLLVDRFLVLAADLPGHESADATLRLVSSLVGREPRRALEIAFMVYKSGLKESESLSAIAQAFDKIDKPQKAELIREKMQRIFDEKNSHEAKQLARLTIEEQVSRTLAEKPKPQIVKNQFVEPGKNPDTVSELKAIPSNPEDPPSAIKVDHREPIFSDVASADNQKTIETIQLAGIKYVNVKLDDAVGEAMAVPEIDLTSVGIPAAIPTHTGGKFRAYKRDSHMVADQIKVEHQSAYKIEPKYSSDDYDRYEPHEHIRPTSADIIPMIREAIEKQDFESVLAGLRELASIKPAEALVLIAGQSTESSLIGLDIRFAGLWLDLLLRCKQERRALRWILKKLEDEPTLVWARMVWPLVGHIRTGLGLAPIEWQESDGVQSLRLKVAGLSPVLLCYAVA